MWLYIYIQWQIDRHSNCIKIPVKCCVFQMPGGGRIIMKTRAVTAVNGKRWSCTQTWSFTVFKKALRGCVSVSQVPFQDQARRINKSLQLHLIYFCLICQKHSALPLLVTSNQKWNQIYAIGPVLLIQVLILFRKQCCQVSHHTVALMHVWHSTDAGPIIIKGSFSFHRLVTVPS